VTTEEREEAQRRIGYLRSLCSEDYPLLGEELLLVVMGRSEIEQLEKQLFIAGEPPLEVSEFDLALRDVAASQRKMFLAELGTARKMGADEWARRILDSGAGNKP